MTKPRQRRFYTKEFKKEVVELFKHGDKSAKELAADLGIGKDLIYGWTREHDSEPEQAFPGTGHLKDPEAERIRQLERQLKSAEEERDILKKALAIFSKAPK